MALVANDDFGDTSALLITLESDERSYRELKEYLDDLSDRLRRIESAVEHPPLRRAVRADLDSMSIPSASRPTESASIRWLRPWLHRG